MKKSPDQVLYDGIYKIAQDLGYRAYTHNPPKGTAYPFVHIAQTQTLPQGTKGRLLGKLFIVVDVWGDSKSRQKVSEMAQEILAKASRLRDTADGYVLAMSRDETSTVITAEHADNEELWRANTSMAFKLR